MDELHHHQNDIHGTFSSARAARARLAALDAEKVLQEPLPGLKARREAIMAEKQSFAAAIGAFGPESHHEAKAERIALVEQLRTLNLQLNEVNAAIAGIPPIMAASDLAAHHEDLLRRVGSPP